MVTFEKIHNDNHSKIFNFLNFRINDHELAEELANDVFVKVHQHLDDYDENISNINTWVYNIAKNVLIDHFRRKKLETISISNFVDDDGYENFVHADNVTPESLMINNQLGINVKSLINSLSKEQSVIMNKFFIEQLSYEEISNELDKPLGTIKATLFRAKELLKEKLSNF